MANKKGETMTEKNQKYEVPFIDPNANNYAGEIDEDIDDNIDNELINSIDSDDDISNIDDGENLVYHNDIGVNNNIGENFHISDDFNEFMDGCTYLIIEKNTYIRELSPLSSKDKKILKKIKDEWHYEGWDAAGGEIKVHNTHFNKIAPLVEFLLKRKKKLPLFVVIIMGVLSVVILIILFIIGAKVYDSMTAKPIEEQKTPILQEFKPPQELVNSGAVVIPPPTASGSEEINFKNIKLDLEYEKYKQDKEKAMRDLDFAQLQKNFDSLKIDYDNLKEENIELQNDSDKYYILNNHLKKWCRDTETNESAELCTKIFSN